MIRFFRKIRQQLLSENHFSKYLLYAVGEIVLVVIGILIALQVNEWNNTQKDRIAEQKLLREMLNNLSSDRTDLQYNISRNKELLEANQVILKHLKEKTPFNDSLSVYYANLFGSTSLPANTTAYENLKSIGVKLITNDSLRRQITTLYSVYYKSLNNLEIENDNVVQFNHLFPQVLNKIKTDRLWTSASPLDIDQLYTDHSFQEMLNFNIFFREFMMNYYVQTERKVGLLMKQIEQELDE